MKLKQWIKDKGELNLQKVKELHQPSYKFRVCEKKHSKKSPKISTTTRKSLIYVTEGAITFYDKSLSILASKESILELAGGDYFYEVMEQGVEFIQVWELPELYWEKEEKDTKESLSEEDEIIRIHCAENDDGC